MRGLGSRAATSGPTASGSSDWARHRSRRVAPGRPRGDGRVAPVPTAASLPAVTRHPKRPPTRLRSGQSLRSQPHPTHSVTGWLTELTNSRVGHAVLLGPSNSLQETPLEPRWQGPTVSRAAGLVVLQPRHWQLHTQLRPCSAAALSKQPLLMDPLLESSCNLGKRLEHR